MATNTSVFAPLIKQEKQADGTLLVTGIATDDTLDVDEQICDPEWLDRAMPEWFKYGNIREQHSNIAAGVATKLEQDGSKHLVTARVVDPSSVAKVEAGVLKGFSIGIRNPRISSDKDARGGRIVDGQIVEVSLVDRPANPACLIELAKSVGGEMQQTENLIEKDAVMERCSKCMKAYKADELDNKMCKMCKAAMETSSEESAVKAADTEESAVEKAAEESSQEPGEESSQVMGEESSREGGVAGVAGKAAGDDEDSEESTEGSDTESSLGEETTEESSTPGQKKKSASKKQIKELMKSVAEIKEMLSELQKSMTVDSAEGIAKSVEVIDERLSKVEKSASRGPARTLVKAAPVSDETVVKAAKAAEYRAKAAATSDPALASGYLLLAAEAETN